VRVHLHDYSGHPFQVQLARELARRGNAVRHTFSTAVQTPRGALERRPDDAPDFEVAGIDPGEALPKYSYLRRFLHERRYGALLAADIERFRPDIAILSNTPPDAFAGAARTLARLGVPYVFWLQDVYTEAIQRIVGGRFGPLALPVIWRYRALEGGLLRGAARVVAITGDFRPLLHQWGVPDQRIATIENWAPLDELPPGPRDNGLAVEHGLADRTVALYAGTLGLKHNPELLAGLAESARDRPDVRVVVISEGLGADYLAEAKRTRGLDNLLLLPFQPFSRLPDVLATADFVVAILEPEADIYSVPSKVLTYHCAGRALLAAMPAANLAARIVTRERTGLVADPGDTPGFLAAARRLLDEPVERGHMGARARAYAERTFDIAAIADRFEQILTASRAPSGDRQANNK